MKLISKKVIQVLSDGSLIFNHTQVIKPKQIVFFKKDHTDFKNKKVELIAESKYPKTYKNSIYSYL